MNIIRRRDRERTRAWLVENAERLRPALWRHRRRLDKAIAWGGMPLTWWAILIRAKAATFDELCEAHGIEPGLQRALTELQVRDANAIYRLARRLKVRHGSVVKWRSLNGVPLYVREDVYCALRDEGITIRRADIKGEIFRAEA